MNNFFNKFNKAKNKKNNNDEVRHLNDLLNGVNGGSTNNRRKRGTGSRVYMSRSGFAFMVFFLVAVASGGGAFFGRMLDRYLLKDKKIDTSPREVHIEGDSCSSGEAVALKVSPSVVSIKIVIRDENVAANNGFDFPFPGMPFFFPFFGGDDKKAKVDKDADVIANGTASGFIFKTVGDFAYVLTNFHVVEDVLRHKKNSEIDIYFDGDVKNFKKAEVLGSNPSVDIAVLKVPLDGRKVVCAEIGDSSKLNKGQEVYLIGSPLSLEYVGSVSHGIVSGLDRELQYEQIYEPVKLIQVDAAMNAGNSGGPLCNNKGMVIGICMAKIAGITLDSIGMCLPINEVMTEVNKILDKVNKTGKGEAPLARLGVQLYTSKDILLYINGNKDSKLEGGAVVCNVEPYSPAARAKIRPGDVITKFDGKPVKDSNDLFAMLKHKHTTDSADITLFNIKTKKERTVTVDFYVEDDGNNEKGEGQ